MAKFRQFSLYKKRIGHIFSPKYVLYYDDKYKILHNQKLISGISTNMENLISDCHKYKSLLSIIRGPPKRQPKNWDMPLFVPHARYSLVKGERIVRFALSTRLSGKLRWNNRLNSIKFWLLWQRLWDKTSLQLHCDSFNLFSALTWRQREWVLRTYFCCTSKICTKVGRIFALSYINPRFVKFPCWWWKI